MGDCYKNSLKPFLDLNSKKNVNLHKNFLKLSLNGEFNRFSDLRHLKKQKFRQILTVYSKFKNIANKYSAVLMN